MEDASENKIILKDQSEWAIGWWYQEEVQKWTQGDRLTITYWNNNLYSNYIEFTNFDAPGKAWGVPTKWPSSKTGLHVLQIFSKRTDGTIGSTLTLNAGLTFSSPSQHGGWSLHDSIMIFQKDKKHHLYNYSTNQWLLNCTLEHKSIENILTLEKRLNQLVLDQPEATRAVSSAMITYSARLKDPNTPIKTFLFLGPTGVGKTELAKALTNEVYHDQSFLLRFEMSHFSEHSVHRLIGTPPGYVDSDKGGQLTEPLKKQPQAVVLLDEIEKAHPNILKLFLPVFDEGYITTAFSEKIPCNHAIFIMTSNLCSETISNLFAAGYTSQQILSKIEPTLMQVLSPEFYARVEPIVFQPLQVTTMERLINKLLAEVIARLKATHQINLVIDTSVKNYLKKNGFHPKLGARPLKALIQNKLISSISYTLLKEQIPQGATLTLICTDEETLRVLY